MPAPNDPTQGLIAFVAIITLFAAIAWICFPRRERRAPDVVKLIDTPTADEAERLAALLREQGLPAFASTEAPTRKAAPDLQPADGFPAFIAVLSQHREAARAAIEEEYETAEDVAERIDAVERATAHLAEQEESRPTYVAGVHGFYDRLGRRVAWLRRWTFRVVGLALVGALCWLAVRWLS